MDRVYHSIGPLSPFLWDVPSANLVPPGFTPGTVAEAMLHIADLTLSFDLLAKAIDPSFHPVFKAMETHQLHTRVLHKRQFDVMQHGMVLDEAERLVLVKVPPLCGDTGELVSKEYAVLCEDDFNSSPCAQHPIVPEHCFVVYQLPAKGEGEAVIPTPIFRLVFRNESFNENMRRDLVQKFPLYRLRSVYVSHKKYYNLRKKLQMYNEASTQSAALPDHSLEEQLGLQPLRTLFNLWVLVLEGIAPSWLVDKGVGPDIVTLFLSHHRADGKYNVKEAIEIYSQLPVDNRIRCSYYLTSARMQRRIQVMRRSSDMINTWRSGHYDIRYFSEVAVGSEPMERLAPCFRMLLCNRKPGRNYVEDDEIAAFVPEDSECQPFQVYNTLAAERLRLWVIKGLLTAELHEVHNLMLEFDTAMVIAECVGLLWGDEVEERHREVVFHVCKIIVETVEDYVQHSGVIWRVIIVTSDEDSARSAAICQDVLEVTQMAKTRVEIEEVQQVAAAGEACCEEIPSNNSEGGVSTFDEEVDVNEKESELHVRTNQHLTAAVPQRPISDGHVLHSQQEPFVAVSRISEEIRSRAMRCGVRLTDGELYPIFLALSGGKDAVPIKVVVDLILEKQDEAMRGNTGKFQGRAHMLWPHDHPICAVDYCGVPYDKRAVTNFVKSFQRRPYRTYNKHDCMTFRAPTPTPPSDSLNYVEFSVMMLALARQ